MERRNLPGELIEEILSRVPAKSLARLRSTSKRWNTLLKSVSFAKMHSANAPKESLIIMLMNYNVYLANSTWTRAGLSDTSRIRYNVVPSVKLASQFYLKNLHFMSPQVYIRKVFHCDGLLLCTTIYKLVVCNPCSGETKWIKPRNRYKACDFYALGYDNKSSYKNYKVLRVDRPGHFADDFYKEYEIYDFTTDSWRVLGSTTDWFLLKSHGESVKGNTYWVAHANVPPDHLFLLSFDFSTERFVKLSLPHDFHDIRCLFKGLSVVREEQLCLCGSFSTDLHVWITTINTGSVMSWRKLLKVKAIDCDISSGMSFLATKQMEDVVCCHKFIQVDRHGANPTCESTCSMILSYVPSLAQIQQK